MTNKLMLSVERELLESCWSALMQKGQVIKALELRALLDKPAAQQQGEPVYMVRSHGSDCWEEMSGESLEMCQAQPAEYEVRKLYAEQPAPVAVAHTMRSVMEAYEAAQKNHLTGTSNFCAAMAARLNGVKP